MEVLEFTLVVIIENSSAQKYMFLLLFFPLKEVKWVEIGHSETYHVTILQFTFHIFIHGGRNRILVWDRIWIKLVILKHSVLALCYKLAGKEILIYLSVRAVTRWCCIWDEVECSIVTSPGSKWDNDIFVTFSEGKYFFLHKPFVFTCWIMH